MHELLGLPYSPWSEKAKWALEVRHVPFAYRQYAPLVGELALRRRVGRWSGRVSVPVLLLDDGGSVEDSTSIARWADEQGEGPALFPPEHGAALERFCAISERGLDAARGLALFRMQSDPEALKELVPRALRGPLGPVAAKIGYVGVRRTLRKYGASDDDRSRFEVELVEALEALRTGLSESPSNATPKTLLPAFSFADIAMSQLLTFVAPPAFGVRMGRASRRNFSNPSVAERFADLIEWRDALYEAHRPRTDFKR